MPSSRQPSSSPHDTSLSFTSRQDLHQLLGIPDGFHACIAHAPYAKNAPHCARKININNRARRSQLLDRLQIARIPSEEADRVLSAVSRCVVCGITGWHQPKAMDVYKGWIRKLWDRYLAINGFAPEMGSPAPARFALEEWEAALDVLRARLTPPSEEELSEDGRSYRQEDSGEDSSDSTTTDGSTTDGKTPDEDSSDGDTRDWNSSGRSPLEQDGSERDASEEDRSETLSGETLFEEPLLEEHSAESELVQASVPREDTYEDEATQNAMVTSDGTTVPSSSAFEPQVNTPATLRSMMAEPLVSTSTSTSTCRKIIRPVGPRYVLRVKDLRAARHASGTVGDANWHQQSKFIFSDQTDSEVILDQKDPTGESCSTLTSSEPISSSEACSTFRNSPHDAVESVQAHSSLSLSPATSGECETNIHYQLEKSQTTSSGDPVADSEVLVDTLPPAVPPMAMTITSRAALEIMAQEGGGGTQCFCCLDLVPALRALIRYW